MSSATVCVLLSILLHLSDAVTVQLKAGHPGTISCGITGTYSFPEWSKDATITLSILGASLIHPGYRDRFSFDQTNNRSLIISNVHLDDKGSYECTHSGGTNSPQTTIVTVIEPSETNNGENVRIANCVLFALVMVVTVVCVIMAYNQIKNMRKKKKEKQNENTKEIKVKTVKMILVIVAILFTTVTVFFIVMQTTVKDFEKLTEKEHIANIALLVVESVAFLLDVIAFFLIWKISKICKWL